MDEFLNRMQKLLQEDFDSFVSSMQDKPYKGLRINTLKCDKDKLLQKLPINVTQTPFFEDGYYIDEDIKIGTHPFHHAGAVYVQEPSAMSAVTMLDVQQGDYVLDLCAAPGSKTTQIAQLLSDTGLLWSNEIVRSRANILLSNIERMGVKNAVVSSASPAVLCEQLQDFFDKILVDAPCSGEGMFRKDPQAKGQWSVEHVLSCANRQLMILNSACKMLKPGGVMVYSTCTYSYEENEGVITQFLSDNPDFELVDSGCSFGRNTLGVAKRVFPMDKGEGHFAAKLRRKDSQQVDNIVLKKKKDKRNKHNTFMNEADVKVYEFLSQIFKADVYSKLYSKEDKVYALSSECKALLNNDIDLNKLNVLRIGVEVLLDKGKRYEPLHNAFTACKLYECNSCVNISIDDDRVYKYLHGESITCDSTLKGYTCVAVEDIPLGFGKAVDGMLKNKYPKGLRNLNG